MSQIENNEINTLDLIRRLAFHIADEIDGMEEADFSRVKDRVVDDLAIAFELLERESGKSIPAAKVVQKVRLAKISADIEAEAAEEDEDDEFIGPMLRAQLDFGFQQPLTDAQAEVIRDMMLTAANYVEAQSDDESLLRSVPVLSALERARRMFYIMRIEVPHEMESILTRHYRLLLDQGLEDVEAGTAH